MEMKMDDDLIKRLEAAFEGSRDLDGRIWQALGNPIPRRPDWPLHVPSPAYTSDFNAAIALVPEGWPQLQIIRTGALGGRTKVSIKRPSEYGWVDDPKPCDGYAATIPLALCIAALKARQA